MTARARSLVRKSTASARRWCTNRVSAAAPPLFNFFQVPITRYSGFPRPVIRFRTLQAITAPTSPAPRVPSAKSRTHDRLVTKEGVLHSGLVMVSRTPHPHVYRNASRRTPRPQVDRRRFQPKPNCSSPGPGSWPTHDSQERQRAPDRNVSRSRLDTPRLARYPQARVTPQIMVGEPRMGILLQDGRTTR